MPIRTASTVPAPRPLVPAPLVYALLFSATWLLHARLLRLPYYWDEAGYFVPAARDLLLTGNPIPSSTLSNAHPPLVMAWLAFWWKFSAFTPAVTRTAMLLVAAFALAGVFRLARQVSNPAVAAASTLLTALYPVFFAQSSLAHLDMAAAGFTLWGLAFYLQRRRWPAVALFALAGLSKETAIVTPLALCAMEAFCSPGSSASCSRASSARKPFCDACFAKRSVHSLLLLLPLVPLVAWYGFHYARTGHVFGNPEYLRYNLGATLSPVRIALALAERVWQLLGYLNMFVLTAIAALAMMYSPVRENNGERPRIALPVQLVFATVIASSVALLAVVGGAVLARYLLPVYPLVVILCVSTLWRRVRWWPAVIGVAALGFVLGLFVQPPYRISPEDNLTYANFVRLHKDAALKLAALPEARVLTAWPASDELTRPYLGYIQKPVPVVSVENFTLAQLLHARQNEARYNYAMVFSSKYEPAHQFSPWWERLQTRYFDYHRDLPPAAAAEVLGGRVIWEDHRGREWVAIIAAGRASEPQNASTRVPKPFTAQ